MRGRALGSTLVMVALVATRVDAQVVEVAAGLESFSFAEPAQTGVGALDLRTMTAGVAYPLGRRIVAGGLLRHAVGTMTSVSGGEVDVAGAADADLFLQFSPGPVQLRGGLSLGTGVTELTAGQLAVSGLVGYELLPASFRRWGRGGGYALEARVPVRSAGYDITMVGALRSHGAFRPFVDDGLEYRIGAQRGIGLIIGGAPTALSRIEAGAEMSVSSPDEAGDRAVYEAGARLAVHGLASFPVGAGVLVVRGDYLRREAGVDPTVPDDGSGPSTSPLGSSTNRPSRALLVLSVRSRSRLAGVPVVAGAHARRLTDRDGEAGGTVLSGQIGTELEVHPPVAGRFFVSPLARLHHGDIEVDEGYASGMSGWEVSVSVRWEAGR